MADLDQTIYQLLAAQAGLTAIVGSRIYPHHLPDDATFPALVFRQVSSKPDYSHDGDSELDTARIQFDAYGTTKAQAVQVSTQVRALLSGRSYRPTIQSSFIENQLPDDYDEVLQAWRTITDYMITYRV